MCNLYTVRVTAEEVARHFGVANPVPSNAGPEVYPGRPGVVVREEDGQRVMSSMTWGFPVRLKHMKPDSKPIPVNNIAEIKKPFWIGTARRPQARCLIPATGFAEAEGPKGKTTRTWFAIESEPIFAWAGLWRVSDEWGPVYSGAMTNANETVRPVHERMPVLLHREDYERWLHGDLDEIEALVNRVFPPELITVERTQELWYKGKPKAPEAAATLI